MSGNSTWSPSWSLCRLKVSRDASELEHLTYVCISIVGVQQSVLIHCLDGKSYIYSVCIRDQKEAFSVKPRFPDQFMYLVLDVEDNEEQNLIRLFPSCVLICLSVASHSLTCQFLLPCYSAKAFIDTAIANGGRVLVHCNGTRVSSDSFSKRFATVCLPGGISLSPSFVVMFVMQHYALSWEDALHMVQNRRYCISPNGGFLTQIKVGFLSLAVRT